MEDPMENLPVELIIEIFSYLSAEDLLSAGQVNRNWRMITNKECLWKKVCEQHDILDYNSIDEPTLNDYCNFAKIYLNYYKTLKNNWLSSRYHFLQRLSAPNTENIICWKRTFVRTYRSGQFVDILTVDAQCKVNRLQRIDLRFQLEGCDSVLINGQWLAVSRLNIILLYKREKDTEYKLKWILIYEWECNSVQLKYLYITDKTTIEEIDILISNFQGYDWLVKCTCAFNNYIWALTNNNYCVVAELENSKAKAAIIKQIISYNNTEVPNDHLGTALITDTSLNLCFPNGNIQFVQPVESLNNRGMLENLRLNTYNVAYIMQKNSLRSVVLINRKSYKINSIETEDLCPLKFTLHPTKPHIFIIYLRILHRPDDFKMQWTESDFWMLRCHGCISNEIIWNIRMWYLPDIKDFQVVLNRFLLLTPIKNMPRKFSLLDCNSGKILSITEDYNQPLIISDEFIVTKIIERGCSLGVKCYL